MPSRGQHGVDTHNKHISWVLLTGAMHWLKDGFERHGRRAPSRRIINWLSLLAMQLPSPRCDSRVSGSHPFLARGVRFSYCEDPQANYLYFIFLLSLALLGILCCVACFGAHKKFTIQCERFSVKPKVLRCDTSLMYTELPSCLRPPSVE